MNLASKPFCLAIASAALVLAGCSKKPPRPDPSVTMLGPQGGGASTQGPSDVPVAGPESVLTARNPLLDANGGDRETLKANTVYFSFDNSDIKADQRAKLKTAKEHLDKNPTAHLMLEGHCDWRGTAEYNLGLGDRRAGAVKKYLISLGVAADRLDTVSKGSLEASKNADAATMEKDRRVDLVIVGAKAPGTAL